MEGAALGASLLPAESLCDITAGRMRCSLGMHGEGAWGGLNDAMYIFYFFFKQHVIFKVGDLPTQIADHIH
jgi:hypothetical protein